MPLEEKPLQLWEISAALGPLLVTWESAFPYNAQASGTVHSEVGYNERLLSVLLFSETPRALI